ncbi:MAG: hypothetical protein CMK89_05185 [Pseudomonadales bacterium]|nr:hypothetical protein [Pseudomonadales bacterium]
MRLLFSSVLCLLCLPAYGSALDDGLQAAEALNRQAVASQKVVDKAADQTQAMLEEYQQLMLDSDFFDTQKNQLLKSIEQQRQKQQQLQQQLDQIETTEKRLAPLLLSMARALEQFIVLDIPFHHQDRIDSVLILRERILDPGLALGDRFQLVMEAFQIELDYSYSLEAYRDQIDWQGESRSVECLRIGRLALYFITPDGTEAGVWNRQEKQWQPLAQDSVRFVLAGIRVAKGQVAPELLPLPLLAELQP